MKIKKIYKKFFKHKRRRLESLSYICIFVLCLLLLTDGYMIVTFHGVDQSWFVIIGSVLVMLFCHFHGQYLIKVIPIIFRTLSLGVPGFKKKLADKFNEKL